MQMTVYMLFEKYLAALHIFVRPLGRTSSHNDAIFTDKLANFSSLTAGHWKAANSRNTRKGYNELTITF